MSQKSSVPQAISFVSQVLKRDTVSATGNWLLRGRGWRPNSRRFAEGAIRQRSAADTGEMFGDGSVLTFAIDVEGEILGGKNQSYRLGWIFVHGEETGTPIIMDDGLDRWYFTWVSQTGSRSSEGRR